MTETKEGTCAVCGVPATKQIKGIGLYCSKAHKKKILEMMGEYKQSLREEPIDAMPEEFERASFERYVLKAAIHMIESLNPGMRKKWHRDNPTALVPEELAFQIKAKVMKHIPAEYLDVKGPNEYEFTKGVPKQVVLDAMVAGKVFKRPPEKGDE